LINIGRIIILINKTYKMRLSRTLKTILMCTLFLSVSISPINAQALQSVTAITETDPVPSDRDAADDPLIWIHPTDPSKSTVMGNDKKGNYQVYDINTGEKVQNIPIDVANTDIRYNFPLGGIKVALVVGFAAGKGLQAWRVNPATRMLEDVTASGAKITSGGGTLYHSKVSGKYYWFANNASTLDRFEIKDNGSGKVTAVAAGSVSFGSGASEGAVADDILGFVYASEESAGLWKINAETLQKTSTPVDKPVNQGGHFTADLEGLAIYYKSDGTGYLIASSQGNNSYTVYKREGNNDYIGAFKIDDGIQIDGTSETDGIEVTNFPLGAKYPKGMFVAQDGTNLENVEEVNQNFKMVSWEQIATKLNLTSDTTWDPRKVGGDGVMPTFVSTPTPSNTVAQTNTIKPSVQPTAVQCVTKVKGDADCDGDVELEDFNIFREEFLMKLRGEVDPVPFESDFNNDKSIDLADFAVFRKGYLDARTPTGIPTVSPTATITVQPTIAPSVLSAFPGAEGFGASQTKGGRGGKVIYVTNLNDTGSGSLREALTTAGPRNVLFKVSGTISLKSDIKITNPFLTIAGHTAPGEGVQVKGGNIMIMTNNVIMRYMKLRSGDEKSSTSNNSDRDSVTIKSDGGKTGDVYNVIIDHSDLIWGPDIGSMAIMWDSRDITIQNSILGEGLHLSNHGESLNGTGVSGSGGHSKGLNIPECCGATDVTATRVTFHHNLLTTSDDRMPQFQYSVNTDFVNNVVYNWGKIAGRGTPRSLNLIKNFFIKGPESNNVPAWSPTDHGQAGIIFNNAVYEAGNQLEGISVARGDPPSVYVSSRFAPYSIIREDTPQEAYNKIIADAGPNKQISAISGEFKTQRDSVDTRIINNLKTRQGKFLNGVDAAAPNISWPVLASGPVAIDTDNDGIADAWEERNFGNLTRGGQVDSSSDFDGDGYTDLEEYLNNTNPKVKDTL
jgi:3-phytase